MSQLILHGERYAISPYVFSVVVALEEKGLPYEERVVDLAQAEHRHPTYLEKSLTGRVPSLEHGDFCLAESSAIVEYLDDAFPLTWRALPQDPRSRARARQIMAWVRSDLLALREERPTTTIFYAPATTPLSDKGLEAANKLLGVADRLVTHDRATIFADFTIADADLSLMLMRLIKSNHDVPEKLRAYAHGIWRRPSVHRFVSRAREPFTPYG